MTHESNKPVITPVVIDRLIIVFSLKGPYAIWESRGFSSSRLNARFVELHSSMLAISFSH